ncbi:MAG: hypothetical protein LBL97_03470 [Prevotellaceae bacterium]|nr:hypothetical protein [Prevotellaceae bacterium]
MKQKVKSYRKITSIIMLAICSMLTVACSGNDDGGIEDVPENLFGTWYASGGSRSASITFYRDGTGIQEMSYGSSDSYYRYETFTFTYTFSNNKIKCSGTKSEYDSEGRTNIQDWETTFEYRQNTLINNQWTNLEEFTKQY